MFPKSLAYDLCTVFYSFLGQTMCITSDPLISFELFTLFQFLSLDVKFRKDSQREKEKFATGKLM